MLYIINIIRLGPHESGEGLALHVVFIITGLGWVDIFIKRIGIGKPLFDDCIDITECGVVKYLDAQGADELGPYICDIDYVGAEAMGIGLRRTKTLAWGCDRCDFRLSKHEVTSAPWPPEFVERTCGQPQTEGKAAAS